MPTYDYICEDTECNHAFEKRSSIADRNIPEVQPCPKCGQMTIKKQIGGCDVSPDALRLGIHKVDEGWNEVLAKIHENTPGSNLGDKLSRTPRNYEI